MGGTRAECIGISKLIIYLLHENLEISILQEAIFKDIPFQNCKKGRLGATLLYSEYMSLTLCPKTGQGLCKLRANVF